MDVFWKFFGLSGYALVKRRDIMFGGRRHVGFRRKGGGLMRGMWGVVRKRGSTVLVSKSRNVLFFNFNCSINGHATDYGSHNLNSV